MGLEADDITTTPETPRPEAPATTSDETPQPPASTVASSMLSPSQVQTPQPMPEEEEQRTKWWNKPSRRLEFYAVPAMLPTKKASPSDSKQPSGSSGKDRPPVGQTRAQFRMDGLKIDPKSGPELPTTLSQKDWKWDPTPPNLTTPLPKIGDALPDEPVLTHPDLYDSLAKKALSRWQRKFTMHAQGKKTLPRSSSPIPRDAQFTWSPSMCRD